MGVFLPLEEVDLAQPFLENFKEAKISACDWLR